MMRRFLWVFLVIVAVAAGAYVYYDQPHQADLPIEAVLPGDTKGMLKVYNLVDLISGLEKSRLGQAVSGIDHEKVMDLMALEANDRIAVKTFLQTARELLDSPWFDLLFGRETALAIQSPASSANRMSSGWPDSQVMVSSAVIIARPSQPAHILDSIRHVFSFQGEIQTQKYREWDLNHFSLNDSTNLYYAVTGGLVIAGMEPGVVQKCLDQSLDPESAMLNSDSYKANAAELFMEQPHDIAFYGAFSKSGVQDAGMVVCTLPDDRIKVKTIMGMNPDIMPHSAVRMTGIRPADNPTLQYVPSGALSCAWQNTFDVDIFWQMLQEHPQVPAELLTLIQKRFFDQTGMSFESFRALFGTQAGFVINEIHSGNMFPVPELALMVEVTDTGAIDRLIREQVKQIRLPLMDEKVGDTTVNYTMLPLGASLSPAYTFRDDFLILATSRELLSTMLTREPGDSISADADFQAVDCGLTKKSNQAGFTRSGAMLSRVQDILTWAMVFGAMARPAGEVETTRQILDTLVYPVMDGLEMVRSVGFCTVNEENRLVSRMLLSLEPSP